MASYAGVRLLVGGVEVAHSGGDTLRVRDVLACMEANPVFRRAVARFAGDAVIRIF